MGGGSVAFDGNNWRPSAKLQAGTEPDDLALILKAAEAAESFLATSCLPIEIACPSLSQPSQLLRNKL